MVMWQELIPEIPNVITGSGITNGSGELVVNHAGYATAPTIIPTITGNNAGFVSVIAGDNTYSIIKTWNASGVVTGLPVDYIIR